MIKNKIEKHKKELLEKKEREIKERKQKIEAAYSKLQKEHGGLNGTDDTGYDEQSMEMYIKDEKA